MTQYKTYACPDCGSFELVDFDTVAEVGIPHCADCGVDKVLVFDIIEELLL